MISKWRLADPIAQELVGRSYAIEMPLEAKVLLWRPSSEFPSLGKVFFTLEAAFAPSSPGFDDYKQSFCFPFLLEVSVADKVIHLLWHLMDYKGLLDFHFRRVIECEEDLAKKAGVMHTFSEMSTADFGYVVAFLVGWIEGYVNTRCEYIQPTEPFFKVIRGSLFVYGYDEGEFFSMQFEDPNEFSAKLSELRQKIPEHPKAKEDPIARLNDTRTWIEKAKQESRST